MTNEIGIRMTKWRDETRTVGWGWCDLCTTNDWLIVRSFNRSCPVPRSWAVRTLSCWPSVAKFCLGRSPSPGYAPQIGSRSCLRSWRGRRQGRWRRPKPTADVPNRHRPIGCPSHQRPFGTQQNRHLQKIKCKNQENMKCQLHMYQNRHATYFNCLSQKLYGLNLLKSDVADFLNVKNLSS